MQKIVITGALGHIGSQLIREMPFLLFNPEIIMFDNFLTQRYCSLFDLPEDGRYKFYEADILKDALEKYITGADALIHLAAITDAASSFENPEKVEEVNYIGTKKVAKQCAKLGVPLIFLSTTSVYGSQSELVDESCPEEELKPQSPYAESKLKAEKLLHKMGIEDTLKYVILRFGTIFGKSIGMRFHTAVNKFIWQASLRVPITVWKTAYEQKRPYLDLHDAVRALCHVIDNKIFPNDVFNVVTINSTVKEIVEQIKTFVPDLQVNFVESRIMNQLSYNVASDKFTATGFSYSGSLGIAVEESVRLLRKVR